MRQFVAKKSADLWMQGLDEFDFVYDDFKKRYRDDPVSFATECVNWGSEKPAPYQLEILENLIDNKRACVRGPHGLGKSAVIAIAVLWFSLTRDGEDWKIPTTSSSLRQLKRYTWPEINKWARALNWERIGRSMFNDNELQLTSLRLSTGEAFASKSTNPELMEGAHANNILIVFDESKAIPNPVWDSMEGAMSTGDAMWIACSTPGDAAGRFYDIQSRGPAYRDWWVRHVTAQECVEARRMDPKWANDRRRQWGETSPIYINRVLGNFASNSEAMIPLSWVEAANERWLAIQESGCMPTAPTLPSVDVSQGEADPDIFAYCNLDTVYHIDQFDGELSVATIGRIRNFMDKWPTVPVVIDAVASGSAIIDSVNESHPGRAIAHVGSRGTTMMDRSGLFKFANVRSAAYWNIRELLNPVYNPTIALPPIDELTGELIAPTYAIASNGAIQVEPKKRLIARIGHSPNYADAVVMAMYSGDDSGEGMDFG